MHPALYEQLLETDIGAKLPVDLFRLSYTAAFIEFGCPSGLSILNTASGEHEVVGAYVGSYQPAPHSFIFEKDYCRQHMGRDQEKPTRVLEIVLSGSPRGKANVLDNASQNVALFVQDGHADLQTAIEWPLAFYRLPRARSRQGFVPLDRHEQDPRFPRRRYIPLRIALRDQRRLPVEGFLRWNSVQSKAQLEQALLHVLQNAVHYPFGSCVRQPLTMTATRRPKVKTATLTVRFDPRIKAAAEAAAQHEHRSLTSFLEMLIINHCRTLGLNPEHFAKAPRQ